MLRTGYILPFSLRYSRVGLLSAGLAIRADGRLGRTAEHGSEALGQVLQGFEMLAGSGALCGAALSPWRSGLRVATPAFRSEREFSVVFQDCYVDDRALVVLAHLLLARHDSLRLEFVDLCVQDERPSLTLMTDPDEDSTLPQIVRGLPFLLESENPESGSYTFTAELERPLEEENAAVLESSLAAWVRAVSAGAYGLAPIPPEESYAEPSEEITFFDTTVEWTVFKVRADPACLDGVVNVFAAFHERCQAVRSLSIS